MRAGQLRHRITIQQLSTTRDDYGGVVETWADFAPDIPASVQPLSGRELIAAQAAQSEARVKMSMRYIPGVTEVMRVSYGGKVYNITAVIDVDERHRELQIMAGTGLNQG